MIHVLGEGIYVAILGAAEWRMIEQLSAEVEPPAA